MVLSLYAVWKSYGMPSIYPSCEFFEYGKIGVRIKRYKHSSSSAYSNEDWSWTKEEL